MCIRDSFPPERSAGIAILSAPGRMTADLLMQLLDQLLTALPAQALEKRLWIVEPGRIRIHATDTD